MGQINVPSRGHEERPDEIASNVTAYGLDGLGGIILEIFEGALHLPWGQSALFVWQRT